MIAGNPEDESAARTRRIARPARARSVWLIVLFVCLASCGGCVLLGGLGWYLYIHDIDEPLMEQDKEVVLTLKDLLPFAPGVNLEKKSETFKRARHHDGSREIEYEYENTDEDDPLYVYSSAAFNPSEEDAEAVFLGAKPVLTVLFAFTGKKGPTLVERNDLFRWGYESKCMLLVQGEVNVGNYFLARKGNKVFSALIVGVSFDKPDVLRAMLTPVLERFDKYQPQAPES